MDKNNESKIRLLALAKILYERTDEEHSLSTQDLMDILESEYQIPTHRTTVPADIQALQEFGMDIQVVRSKQVRFNLLSREFDNAELKLLIDAIASSKFISKVKSEKLAEKIAKLAGQNKAEELKRNISVERRIKTDNEKVLFIIDAINEAINRGKKIQFQYFEYNGNKERIPRFDGYFYRINPYRLVWCGDFYYVVGRMDKYDNLSSYRVDRMAGTPDILNEDVIPLPEDFDMDHYLNTMYHMFSTKRRKVTLICSNDVMDAIIDRFGEDVETSVYDSDRFRADVEVAVNKTFYMWIFGFDGMVRILEPDSIKREYVEMVQRTLENLTNKTVILSDGVSDDDDLPFE